jgi:hypothetical protein
MRVVVALAAAAAAAAAVAAAKHVQISGALPDDFASSNVSLTCLESAPLSLCSSSPSSSSPAPIILISRTLGRMRTWRLGGDGCSSSITHIIGHGSTVLSLTRVPASSFSGQVLVLKRFSVLFWVADVWEFLLLLFKASSLLV